MGEILTIKQASKYLNMSESAVRNHLIGWGFFQMPGSRVWRVHRSYLDKIKKQGNNPRESTLFVSNKRGNLCHSTNGRAVTTLILQRKLAAELDARLKRA